MKAARSVTQSVSVTLVLGTEEVEVRVRQQWPEARITRWDRDTTAGKDAHEALACALHQPGIRYPDGYADDRQGA